MNLVIILLEATPDVRFLPLLLTDVVLVENSCVHSVNYFCGQLFYYHFANWGANYLELLKNIEIKLIAGIEESNTECEEIFSTKIPLCT